VKSLAILGSYRMQQHIAKNWGFGAMLAIAIACAAFFGACLTSYVMFVPGHPYQMQVIASIIKVPTFLLISLLLSTIVIVASAKLIDRSISVKTVAKAAFYCYFVTSICLAILGPVIAILSLLGNYSIVILTSYLAFILAGSIGSFSFFRHLAGGSEVRNASTKYVVTLIWCLCFGLISADVGWSLRPFVGWTGQPFAWLRDDQTHIWNQIVCETRNMRFGGIRFPSAGEESASKAWPC
jgi:hypothetical protein